MRSNIRVNPSFKEFILNGGRISREEDVLTLFRLLDPCRENKINFEVFKRIFTTTSNYDRTLLLLQKNGNHEILESNGTTRLLYKTGFSNRINSTSHFSLKDNKRESNLITSNFHINQNLLDDYESSFSDTINESSILKEKIEVKEMKEFDIFLEYLKDVLKFERAIERMKCELAVKDDFNLHFLFKFFEYQNLGTLSSYDLKYGFNLFGLFPTLTELNLLINRYDGSKAMK